MSGLRNSGCDSASIKIILNIIMSSAEAVDEKAPRTNKRGQYRKRRPQNRRAAPATKDTEGAAKVAEVVEANVVKRERPEMVPVPAELVGKEAEGTVVSVIRKGKYNFGFISLSTGDDYDDNKHPRIYFNPSYLADSSLYLRRGYVVKFNVSNDEEGRSVAKDIDLTEAGTKIKTEREAIIAQKRSERLQQQPKETKEVKEVNEATVTRRRREPRKPREYKKITLKAQKAGSDTEKIIEFALNQSIGKLKSIATKELEAPIEYSVFHVTSENPEGVFLTKSILNKLTDNDIIRLAPKPEAQ